MVRVSREHPLALPKETNYVPSRSFGTWLQRLTTVTSDTKADLSMTKAFSANLYSASQQCGSSDGTTQYSASLSIDVHGSFNAKTQFG